MQFSAVGQPLDRRNVSALHLGRQNQAGIHGFAIDNYRTTPALSLQAGTLRPRKTELHTEAVEKRNLGINRNASPFTIKSEFQRPFLSSLDNLLRHGKSLTLPSYPVAR